MLLAVVIVTGWVTTVYSNFKEEDIMSSREPASVLVLADVESSAAHTRVTDQILAYLRAVGGVDKVYYVRDARDGPRPGESVESWWRRALRDQKVIKDGSVIFFPGPPSSSSSPQVRRGSRSPAPRCCCRPRAGTSSPRRWRCCARTRGTPPPPRS